MRGHVLILLFVLLATGCKLMGEKAPATPASKNDDTAKAKGPHWLDDAKPEWAKGDVPKADSWADPRDKKFDYTNSVKGALAGYVLDLGEKPAPNAIIAVEPASPNAKTKPMVVLADQTGSFVVHGLTPNETYSLTAKVRDGKTLFVGQTHATPPSVHVRIRLKEQMALPSGPGFGQIDGQTPIASRPTAPGPPPADDLPPLPGAAPIERDRAVAPPAVPRSPGDGGWSPIRSTNDAGELPMPGLTKPDQTATGGSPGWKPPTVDMPSPTITPPPVSNTVRKKTVSLLDASGRTLAVPNGLPGELVLLDFMATWCVPCKKAIPELVEFQRRYGANGVEVIGVLCDQASDAERRKLGAKYATEQGVNYLIHTEATAGEVQKRFQVKGYPTLVLLDSNGEVLWSGHPSKMKEMEPIVRDALSKR